MKQRYLALLLAIAISVPSLGQTDPRADLYRNVEAALRARDFAQALQLIDSQLPHFPRDARLRTFQGLALVGLKRNPDALTAFDKALSIAPDYLPALQGAAQLEFAAGDVHAVPRLERILRQLPNDPTSHAMLGVLAYRQHDCPGAVKHFAQSIALVSTQPAALAEYGSCLLDTEQASDAISVFRQLVSQFPDDAHARFDLAEAQVAARQGKDAVETLQPLLNAEAPDGDVLDLASTAYESQGDTPKAVELLRRAIVLNPARTKYYVDFAIISFNHQSFQVGVDMVSVGLKVSPNAAQLYIARGILYIQMSQFDKGEADFQMAARIDPSQASGAIAQGMAQIQQSNLDEALATVKSQLASHPKEAFLYYLKAQILVQKGAETGSAELNEAIDAATRATQLEPEFVLPRDILGNLYLKSGQPALAIEQCRLALRGNPSDQEALYHLIQALRQSGKGSKTELAELVQQLADLRKQSRDEEASANKYKLYEAAEKKVPDTPQ